MTRGPLHDDPSTRPYAAILDRCAQALLEGFRSAPGSVALVEADRPDGGAAIAFGTALQVAAGLLALADGAEGERRAALRDVAAAVVRPHRADASFACVVVTDRGCALIELSRDVLAHQATLTVSMCVATFRGLVEGESVPVVVPGLGFAVRNDACVVCRAWKEALSAAKIPLVGRRAPEPSPCDGETCRACILERESVTKNAAAHYGASPESVARASAPAAVLEAIGASRDD